MAKIVSCLNQKGGVGKSSIALALAGAFAELPARVLLVDCDQQQTSLKIASGAAEDSPFPATVISLHAADNKLGEMLRPHMENYDYIVIDGPPSHMSKISRAAAAVSDLIVIPTIPSKPDLLATLETAELLKELEDRLDAELPARILVNQVERTRIKRAFDDVIAESMPYPALKTEIRKRTSFREAAAAGIPITSFSDAAACQDVRNLRDEILAIINE